jgi:polyphosphate kinase
MAVQLKDDHGHEQLVLVNVPCPELPRFYTIQLPEANYIIFLEDVISANLHYLFGGYNIIGSYNIKITRDAELNLKDEYDEDLVEKIEKLLLKRDHGHATRILYEPSMPLRHLHGLVEIFQLNIASLVAGGRYHNLKDLAALPLNNPALSYPPWPALQHRLSHDTLFGCITGKDAIVHTPYQSYETILRFFNEAVIDPSVTEIFTTLYRVASDSRIVMALISAAKNGRKVTVMVELKARFDEANNIRWAKKLKANGVKLVYSRNALKVHAKVALVIRHHPTHPLLGAAGYR